MSQMSRSINSQEDISPIAKVEHFYAQSSHPQKLYQFLSREFLLPEVWAYADYGTFASGGFLSAT